MLKGIFKFETKKTIKEDQLVKNKAYLWLKNMANPPMASKTISKLMLKMTFR